MIVIVKVPAVDLPCLTQAETAKFLTRFREPITARQVRVIEERIYRKLARLPEISEILPDVLAQSRPRRLHCAT